MPAFGANYPTRETTSPFYSGYRAGVLLNNARFLVADSWSFEIKDEPIELTTVQIFRDSNIETTPNDFPEWFNRGVPRRYVKGGMFDATIKLHGFYKELPILNIGEFVTVSLMIDGNRTFFRTELAFVTSYNYAVTVKGTIEWNIDLVVTLNNKNDDTDTIPRF